MPDFNQMQRQRLAAKIVLLPESWRTDTLAHYGIKGQKWGIRRYQNENGTLTNAGKKRYSSVGIKLDVARAKRQARKENVSGRSKQSTGANYDKAVKKKNELKKKIDKRYNETVEKEKRSKSTKEAIQAWNDFDRYSRASIERGRRMVSEAMLKDAGYSSEDAKAGYEYLKKRGINLYF